MPIIRWIFSHKAVCFVYVPLTAVIILILYSGYVYTEWRSDRNLALDRLSRYKKLIDITEEMKKGYPFSQNEIDINAKAVDIPTRIYDRNV
jgi:hypothetical protein